MTLVFSGSGDANETLTSFDLPPAAESVSVGDGLSVNGVGMRIEHFVAPLTVDEALAFYRSRWGRRTTAEQDPAARAAAHLTLDRVGNWQVLGRQVGARHETVQVRALPEGGVEGYIAATDTQARPATPPAPPVSLPPGTAVISTVASQDGSRSATEILAQSPLGVDATERWLRSAARLRGFQPAPGFDEARPAGRSERAFYMSNGADELTAVVQPAKSGSLVLLHHVRAAGGRP